MNMVRTSAAGSAATAVLVSATVTGCGRWRLFGNVDDSVEFSRIVQRTGNIEHQRGSEPSDPIGLQQLAHQTQ